MAKRFYFGSRSLENTKDLRPDLFKVIEHGLSYGIIDYGVPAKAGRTLEEQKELYAIGRTKELDRSPVTWTLKTNHLIDPETGFCNAVDVVPYVNGRYNWTVKHCLIMATCIFRSSADLGISLQWGFHLWGKDYPHFQKLGKIES